jgi:hypothetical protein
MIENQIMISQAQNEVNSQEADSIILKHSQNQLGSVVPRKSSSDVGQLHANEFEKLKYELTHNIELIKDYILGKRIGFYSIGDDLGNGNFSQVKLGVHLLTKGTNKSNSICR